MRIKPGSEDLHQLNSSMHKNEGRGKEGGKRGKEGEKKGEGEGK